MEYKPKPVDTQHIKLSEDLLKLTESLAENAHDIWARQRMSQGWTYGPQRDDQKNKHPDLVPYSSLTEEEKEYDRKTAMETVKMIMALGYKITKSGGVS